MRHITTPRSITRRTARKALATATVGVLFLSACGSDDDDAGASAAATPSTTVTVTEEATAGDEPAPEDPGTPANTEEPEAPPPDSPDDPNCEPDPESPVITDSIENLAPPGLADSTWVYKGDSNFNACSDLSYATVEQDPQGNSQFENKLIFFHQGRYSGSPQTDAPQQHEVVGTTDDSVTVRFKDWQAQEDAGAPNAEAGEYTEEVTFRWVDGAVVAEGRIPNEPQQIDPPA
ncbi:MAG: LppP/LprE family lipoprotein [Corynebacterium sp.]|uniref:LppP/LprE family lipoprotein n=1 Tax=Corynebacterium sp. TaxID=1720 RepID=UPI003F95214E